MLPPDALRLTLDLETLTLDELEIFSEPDKFKVSIFKKFLASHSNWTAAQVGALTLAEMRTIAPIIGAQMAQTSPKVK